MRQLQENVDELLGQEGSLRATVERKRRELYVIHPTYTPFAPCSLTTAHTPPAFVIKTTDKQPKTLLPRQRRFAIAPPPLQMRPRAWQRRSRRRPQRPRETLLHWRRSATAARHSFVS